MKTYDIFFKSPEDSHFYLVSRPVATRVLPPSSLSRPSRKRVPAGDHLEMAGSNQRHPPLHVRSCNSRGRSVEAVARK